MSTYRGTETPGLFLYRVHGGGMKALHFQFNPESLKRTRTASVKASDAGVNYTTPLSPETTGSRFFVEASSWKVDFDLRLEGSKAAYKEPSVDDAFAWDAYHGALAGNASRVDLGGTRTVRRMITALESMIEPLTEQPSESESENNNAGRRLQPHPIEFYWGDRVWFGYLTSLTVNETQFNLDLQPMRAEVAVSMEIIQTDAAFDRDLVGGLMFAGEPS